MKNKHVLSLFTALILLTPFGFTQSAQAQTIATVCPAGYTCSPITVTCPTGYVCVVATQPVGCPLGYTCTSTVTPPPPLTPTTDATVTVNGQPKLALTYDSKHGEAALTATVAFSVHGNTQGIDLFQNGAGIAFNSGKDQQGASLTQPVITPVSFASTTVDAYGRNVFIISPGQTASFTVTASANPKQMFAGSYTASLQGIDGDPIPASSDGTSVYVVVPSNQSNSVTIVGEVSPYISSVSPATITPGQTLILTGQRLKVSDAVYIDGVNSSAVRLNPGGSPASLSLQVPTLATGFHSLYINDNQTGASNDIGFQVTALGCYTFTNNLSIGSTGPDVVALQTRLIANGFDIHAISSGAVQKGYFGVTTAAALKQWQISVGLPATGVFGALSIAKLNASCGTTNAQILASLDSVSPVTSTVQISATSVTNVPLAVFDLESQNQPSTLETLSIGVPVTLNGQSVGPAKFFTNLFITVGGQTYAENASVGQTVTFNNLSIGLPANVNVPITVSGAIPQDTNGSLDGSNASVNLPLSGIVAMIRTRMLFLWDKALSSVY